MKNLLIQSKSWKISLKSGYKCIFFTLLFFLIKKNKIAKTFCFKLSKKYLKFLRSRKKNHFLNFINLKRRIVSNALMSQLFNFLYQALFMFKTFSNLQILKKNFYENRESKCAIVKAHFNFSNVFVLITSITGEIKNWVSTGTGGFVTKIERSSPQAPISITLRTSNVLARKKYKYVKIQYLGPSKRFRSKIFHTLQIRSWMRKFRLNLIEDKYSPAFNGCRLKRAPRK